MLRTVKLLALVAMFFVALSASAQVTTSAMSGVVNDENQEALIGATVTVFRPPSVSERNVVTNIDDNNYNSIDIHPKVPIGDEYTILSGPFLVIISIIILSFFLFLIIAIFNNYSIRIKYSKFKIEIISKKEVNKKEVQ